MTNSDLPQHIAKGEQKRRQYDYTEIEDRLRLKLDILRDKLRDLTAAELEELESGLDSFTRLAKLLLSRHKPTTTDERPDVAPLGPCETLTPDKQYSAFHGEIKNPMPIKRDADSVNFFVLIEWADSLGIAHNETEWLDDERPDKEDELRVAVAEAMEKVGK